MPPPGRTCTDGKLRAMRSSADQLRSALGARSVRIVPASLDELPVTREARLLDVVAASLFMVPLVLSVLLLLVLVELVVVAGLAGLVTVSVEPLLIVVVPAVPLTAGLGMGCMVGSVGSGGTTIVGWACVCGLVVVPGALPVAVCALAKPITPTVAATTTADVRIFDAFMCLAPETSRC